MSTSVASRGALGFAGAFLAGGISAAIFAVALDHADSPLFFVVYLSALPLFVAGLGAGSVAGLIAAATGLVGLLLMRPSNYAFIYTFIDAIPSVILITLALRYRVGADQKTYWYPEGNLLTAITIYPCVLFVFIVSAVAAAGHEGGLLDLTTKLVNGATEPMKAQMDAQAAAQFSTMVSRLVVFLPALTGVCWIFVTLIDMIAGQLTLQKQGWNLRSGFGLQELRIPTWLIYAVALTGLAGAAGPTPFNYVGANLSIILGIPFFFSGLGVVHAWADAKKATTAILVVFYIFLSIFPMAVLVVALLGVIDQWANFRKRFIPKPKSP